MNHKFSYKIYVFLRESVRLFYPKTALLIPKTYFEMPCVFVGNHSQVHGPITSQLLFPMSTRTWCAGEMSDRKAVPAYAYRCFWENAPKWQRPFYKALSHLIAPLAEIIFKNTNTLPVYLDERILTTFRKTLAHLEEGGQILLFPETEHPDNHILNTFHEHFADLGRMYYRKTGKSLAFVPVYFCPNLCEIHAASPVYYDPQNSPDEERTRICRLLSERITKTAMALPEHEVIPFLNTKERRKNK